MAARVLIGPKKPLKKLDKGFNEYFFEKTQVFGDSVFQIHAVTGEKQTYKQVLWRSIRVAIALQKLGVKSKDIVMLCCYNDLDNIVPWIASLFLGAVICSVDPELDYSDIHTVTNLVKPKVVFVVDEMLDVMQNALKMANSDPEIVVIGKSELYPQMSDWEKRETQEEQTFKPAKTDPYDTAFILLSSGTTSSPKGICLNQHRFMDYALIFEQVKYPVKMTQKSSMYWVSAVFTTYQIIAVGGLKIVAPKLGPWNYLKTLSKYKVNSAILSDGSVYAVADLLENPPEPLDLSSLKIVLVGGARVEKLVILKLRKLLPEVKVMNAYGSTEIGWVTDSFALTQDPTFFSKADTVGKVVANVELKIVDIETGKTLPPNQEGELLVKTPYLMTEYYNYKNPDVFDDECFFKTGDLAYYDEDEFLFITDRINSTFKILLDDHYYKISPSTVEDKLLQHPAVKEAIVFGLPDDKCIKLPAAIVVLKNCTKPNIADDILEFANNSVPNSHKLRGGLKIVNALPKTATGKISRKKCIKLFSEI